MKWQTVHGTCEQEDKCLSKLGADVTNSRGVETSQKTICNLCHFSLTLFLNHYTHIRANSYFDIFIFACILLYLFEYQFIFYTFIHFVYLLAR